MYRSLFDLAGLAILGWLPLIFLPRWRGSRWLAHSMIFPVYLALLYLIGIVPIVAAAGPRIMADFGDLESVLVLLAREEIALIVWIHVLAFDHLVGLFIYRDNMQNRIVSLPVQSVILFLTLMFGPVGFLIYGAIRMMRFRSSPSAEPSEPGVPDGVSRPRTALSGFLAATLNWLRREPLIAGLGAAGVLLGALCFGAIPFLGVEVPPEGHLLDTATFNLGVGMFVLTLAAILPLAPFSARGGRRWRGWMAALVVYFYSIETVQAFRGLDPRFTRAGGVVDQIAGAIFGLTALGFIVVTMILAVSFFRSGKHDLATLALCYGFGSVTVAFVVGLWMSAIQGRHIGAEGNLLVAHGVGFHGLQAVPLVALLLLWSRLENRTARRVVHAAGGGWLIASVALVIQAAMGETPLAPTITTGIAAVSLTAWAAALAMAGAAWLRGRVAVGEFAPSPGLPQ